jgi:hypothetical protein
LKFENYGQWDLIKLVNLNNNVMNKIMNSEKYTVGPQHEKMWW